MLGVILRELKRFRKFLKRFADSIPACDIDGVNGKPAISESAIHSWIGAGCGFPCFVWPFAHADEYVTTNGAFGTQKN